MIVSLRCIDWFEGILTIICKKNMMLFTLIRLSGLSFLKYFSGQKVTLTISWEQLSLWLRSQLTFSAATRDILVMCNQSHRYL